MMDRSETRKEVLMRHLEPNGSSSSRGSDSASSSSSSGLHVHAEHVSGDLVGYQVEGGVAFLSIQNPPVNSLSQQVMRQICSQHRRAIEDPAVRAIVVCGSRGKFIAGADIAMMHKMQQKDADFSEFLKECNDTLNGVEAASKPTVAAIESFCLGGGLEVAMACHARVAAGNSQLGLPELQLGLIPGFGGTQRLPRLVGVQKGVEMMLLSRSIGAADALKAGLVDEVVEDPKQLLAAASRLALELTSGKVQLRRSLLYSGKVEPPQVVKQICAVARDQAKKVSPQVPHPFECIDAIEEGALRGGEAGLQAEFEAFLRLCLSPSAKALIHFFLATRAVNKVPGVTDQGLSPRPVRSLAVIGGGLMGAGIACAALMKGIPVRIKEIDERQTAAAASRVKAVFDGRLNSNRMSQAQYDKAMSIFSTQTTFEGFREVDMCIEAVIENVALKQRIFADLVQETSPTCILATNTSTINIDLITEKIPEARDRVVGLHFFSPAHVMKLLEIVRTNHTSAQVLCDSLAFGSRIGKTNVMVGNCPGFAVNRIFFPYGEASNFLLDRGISPYRIDKVISGFGMPMGPFRMGDMAGVDVLNYTYELMGAAFSDRSYKCTSAALLVKNGRAGEKTGKGYYSYETRRAQEDPEALRIVEEARREVGAAPAHFSDEEIVETVFFAVVNEACRVIDEGIAVRSSDVDVAAILGYGFPVWRGGLIQWADSLGAEYVYSRLNQLYQKFGEPLFKPCEYLRIRAEKNLLVSAAVSSLDQDPDEVVIVAACRTPVCRAFRGSLKDTSPDDLLAPVIKRLLDTTPQVSPEEIGDVVVGCVLPKGDQGAIDARVAGLLAGLPESVPVRTVNRLCSSGLQAIADVAASIQSGYYDIGIAAGVESMSKNPMLWKPQMNEAAKQPGPVQDSYLPMGLTSENVAKEFGIERDVQDEFAAQSHAKAAAAAKAGRFRDEIVPIRTKIVDPKTEESRDIVVDADDGIRPGTTAESLGALKPAFKKDGRSTAGNSSQMSDGASAVLLMKRKTAADLNLPVMAALKSFAVVGVPPGIMGVGPLYAIPRALEMAGVGKEDIDLYEVNEAFASQCLYCLKELDLPQERVNVNGGAVALGHPLGCTGARLTTSICYEAKRRGAQYGVVSMCIGTGMGAAAVFQFS